MGKDGSESDAIIELIEIYINAILYARKLYPAAIFQERKTYNIAVRVSIFRPLNKYLEKCLMAAQTLKRQRKLNRVEVQMYDTDETVLESYLFDIEEREFALDLDPNLFQFEEELRKSLLAIGARVKGLRPLPTGATFKVLLHTTEAAFVKLSTNPRLQDCPFVQETTKEVGSRNNTQLLPVSHTENVTIQICVEEYFGE